MKLGVLAAAALVLLAFGAGCGGDSDSVEAVPRPRPEATVADRAYAAKANAICRDALAQTRKLGERFRSAATESDLLKTTTEHLVKPGIVIRARMADRLRGLPAPTQGEEAVAAYVELFDPIEALSRDRLRAGLAGDIEESARFEQLLLSLGEEQTAAARLAGLDACTASFVTAATGR
jgi:hypothetical protein